MPRKTHFIIISFLLVLATLIAFWHVTNSDFINVDDQDYVTENSHVQGGLSLEGITWAFFTGHSANWHPLTWISHMLDIQLFGLKPHPHHAMNLLLHIASTVLLFFVLHRMTKALWQSAFVAALFALHPLHVQSVAWVAERKDVLSAFFWMLTMCAYSYYAERRSLARYLSLLVFFALGLMAKPMLVTLPFVLLLLDYWPMGRLEQRKSADKITASQEELEKREPSPSGYPRTSRRTLLLEKIPLFGLATLSSVVTYLAQHKGGATASLANHPLALRIENAFISYVTYIVKMIWPDNLSVFYPYQKLWPFWQVLGAVLFFVAVTLLAVWAANRYRYLTVGWLWYVGTLVPVIGLVQVGEQARADRYTYIPLIGLFIMMSWSVPELMGRWRISKKVLLPLSVLVLFCFFCITRIEVGHWQNSFTLFDHALKVTDNNHVAYYSRGSAYADALGNYEQAIKDYDRAIEINPRLGMAYNSRGNAYAEGLGNYEQAIKDYDRAIAIDPKYTLAYNNRGNAYAALGNYAQAINEYDRAIAIDPTYALAYYGMGNAFAALGNYAQAISDYDRAIAIDPTYAMAYTNRGNAHGAMGNYGQAIFDYNRAIGINPKLATAYRNRAVSYDRAGNGKQALEDLKTAAALGDKTARDYLRAHGMR